MKAIVDSNIIIDFLNNNLKAVQELSTRDGLAVSVVTYIEVIGGIKDVELQFEIRQFFKQFEIINIDNKIAEETIKIRQQSKMKLPDALILATALVNNVVLLSRNDGFKQYPNAKCPYKI